MTDRTLRDVADLDALDLAKGGGLVPMVAQDADTGAVLMVAYANHQALAATLDTGVAHFWSRSRQAPWRKGETSGNTLHVVSLHADCDGDTVLARVRPTGPACHTGEPTCFGEGAAPAAISASISGPGDPGNASHTQAHTDALAVLDATLARRQKERPEGSYTVRLLDDENLRLKKLGEETAELVTALAKGDAERIPEEAADLMYHL
ncbi:MAG: bifunctional phosphoribosyl-AMP cyclohydrolase/phosphoribosyl-ATP diphosphatase HisIE, partial [Gemmatimonadota bacterium]|nr:bifunctional phosphoribosyl-AMP cyclohydrolase/phosphoribosyl-ATP diphosphatase HisIE [Gemmatimonadota bacterium]